MRVKAGSATAPAVRCRKALRESFICASCWRILLSLKYAPLILKCQGSRSRKRLKQSELCPIQVAVCRRGMEARYHGQWCNQRLGRMGTAMSVEKDNLVCAQFVGIDSIIYGVEDMDLCHRFFDDWGLRTIKRTD